MPTITTPPKTMADVPKSVRAKLTRLLFERAVLGYTFSFSKLAEFLSPDDIRQCIIAQTEDDAKKYKAEVNDEITAIYTENGIEKTLRDTDPFGNPKDYIMMEGVATSFSQNRALPVMVAGVFQWDCPECDTTNYTPGTKKVFCSNEECMHHTKPIREVKPDRTHNMAAEAVQAAFAAATIKTTYVALQCRDVKEDNDGKKKK